MRLFKKRIKETNVLKKINKKSKVIKYMYLIIGCFLVTLAFNVFFAPYDLVTGGVSGIAIIVEKIFNIPIPIFIFVTYIFLLILSYIFLGKEVTKCSIIGSLLYPLFIYLTEGIGQYIQFNVDNMLLICIFGALIYGVGSGLVFKYGFSTGGSDIICQIISKYFKISIGDSIRISNTIIILGSGFFLSKGSLYAWENVMYSVIIVYIVSILNDKVLLGISSSKSFYIITEHETDIKKFLINELHKGVTVLEGRGGYTGNNKKVLLCVIPTKEYFLAKEGILEIDKNAIVLINDVYQSSGIE